MRVLAAVAVDAEVVAHAEAAAVLEVERPDADKTNQHRQQL